MITFLTVESRLVVARGRDRKKENWELLQIGVGFLLRGNKCSKIVVVMTLQL